MPRRIGHLYERMVERENCIAAEKLIAKNKPDNKMAQHIARNAERYGEELFEKLRTGTFEFHENRETTITDTYKGKIRHLKIPCLEDQAAQQAWLIIAIPYIVRRNYFYNCGSIPNAGQTRATNGLKKVLKAKKCRYGATSDIRHFYETCPHKAVLRGLRRIFKDKKFIDFAARIMRNMSPTGVGLAIGHPTSHWFANVALMEIDQQLRRLFPDVWFTRYMDDVSMASNNKRHLRGAFLYMKRRVQELGMRLKDDWQIFRIARTRLRGRVPETKTKSARGRGIPFLSYTFYPGFTVLRKRLMYRISRKMKKGRAHLSLRMAEGIVSYIGILKHCNSHNYRQERVLPFVNPKKCRRIISNASKDLLLRAA